jgi:rare lipoprotein A
MAFLLAGCSSQQRTYEGQYRAGRPMYKVGAPYQINGVWYYPAVDYDYDDTGIASWYGEQFERKYTANGEIFGLNGLTAAHRTLPMPSIVQVTNLNDRRTVQVRVNDRGPFARSRILDVSRRASQLLGFETGGTAPVRVKIIKEESIQLAELAKRNGGDSRVLVAEAPSVAKVAAAAAVRPAPSGPAAASISTVSSPRVVAELPPLPEKVRLVPIPSSHIFIQAGAFSAGDNAQRVQSRIASLGSVQVMSASVKGVEMYRVRLGRLASVAQADQLLARVVDSGYPEARIIVD